MSVWIGVCPPSTLLQPLACALLRFTPDLALAPESVILMDVTASVRLFGGIGALRTRLRGVLAAFDTARTAAPGVAAAPPATSIVVSVAASWAVAWMLARSGHGGSALKLRSLRRGLARTPLTVAPPARPFADWFRDLGCNTLADLRRLPRTGLKKRCGPVLLAWLDQLTDAGVMPYPYLRPPPEFDQALELPDHIEHAPALQWAAQRLILQLCGWLAGRQQDVAAFTLWLAHERRLHRAGPSGQLSVDEATRVPITLGTPAHDPAILTRLVQEHLARLTLPASVIAVRLRATRFQDAQAPSLELFPEPGGTSQDHAQLLAVLAARLGADNLLVPAPVADHRPERAARWAPLGRLLSAGRAAAQPDASIDRNPAAALRQACGPCGDAAQMGSAALPRPAWLLDAPLPLELQGHRPFYGTPLRLVSPAERLDCGWQDDGPVTRDYFVAEDESGACYWVFRADGVPGKSAQTMDAGSGPAPHWFLHGLFG